MDLKLDVRNMESNMLVLVTIVLPTVYRQYRSELHEPGHRSSRLQLRTLEEATSLGSRGFRRDPY